MSEYHRPKPDTVQYHMRNHVYVPEVPRIINPEGIVFTTEQQQEKLTPLPYKEWVKEKEVVPPGTLITDIHPRDLFTIQDWLRPEKWMHAVEAQQANTQDAFVLPGRIYTHPKEHVGQIPVLLGGNHRAVRALQIGTRVSLKIVEKEVPEDAQVWRVTNLYRKYGGGLDRVE